MLACGNADILHATQESFDALIAELAEKTCAEILFCLSHATLVSGAEKFFTYLDIYHPVASQRICRESASKNDRGP